MASSRKIGIPTFLLLLSIGLFLGILLGGAVIYKKAQSLMDMTPVVEEEATIVLERIEKVCKLITVEGQFANILDHKDYIGYDFFPFRKKALLKITAKVSVGYDLEQLNIDINHDDKTFYISNVPEPEVLSIDPDISYYDLQEGYFNYFSEAELTSLNRKAKDMVKNSAEQSKLLEEARKQGIEVLKIVEIVAEASGWKVKYDNAPNRGFADPQLEQKSYKRQQAEKQSNSVIQKENPIYTPPARKEEPTYSPPIQRQAPKTYRPSDRQQQQSTPKTYRPSDRTQQSAPKTYRPSDRQNTNPSRNDNTTNRRKVSGIVIEENP